MFKCDVHCSGNITIPSDDDAHNVTIISSNWVPPCLGPPSQRLMLECASVYGNLYQALKQVLISFVQAKITNASEYTLLPWCWQHLRRRQFYSNPASLLQAREKASTARSAWIPQPHNISPPNKKDHAECFYTKTAISSLLQAYSIHNTKSIQITDLRIIDQIPVSSATKSRLSSSLLYCRMFSLALMGQ